MPWLHSAKGGAALPKMAPLKQIVTEPASSQATTFEQEQLEQAAQHPAAIGQEIGQQINQKIGQEDGNGIVAYRQLLDDLADQHAPAQVLGRDQLAAASGSTAASRTATNDPPPGAQAQRTGFGPDLLRGLIGKIRNLVAGKETLHHQYADINSANRSNDPIANDEVSSPAFQNEWQEQERYTPGPVESMIMAEEQQSTVAHYESGKVVKLTLPHLEHFDRIDQIILNIQCADGILAFAAQKDLYYLQRPQVGAKIVVAGSGQDISKALDNLFFYSASKQDLTLVLSGCYSNQKSFYHECRLSPIAAAPVAADDITIRNSGKVIYLPSDRLTLELSCSNPLLTFTAPLPTRMKLVTANHKTTLLGTFDKISKDRTKAYYSFVLEDCSRCISGLELSQQSQALIAAAVSSNSDQQARQAQQVRFRQELDIIIDVSAIENPQLAVEDSINLQTEKLTKYSHAKDIFRINIRFSEPIVLQGQPKLQLLLEQNRTVLAQAVTKPGLHISQTVCFEYQISKQDKAIHGIELGEFIFDEQNQIFGYSPLASCGLPAAVALPLGQQLFDARIADQQARSVASCISNGKIWRKNQIDLAIAYAEHIGKSFLPELSTDMLQVAMPRGTIFAQLVTSKNLAGKHNIHYLHYNFSADEPIGIVADNSWKQAKYHPVNDPKYRGLSFQTELIALSEKLPELYSAVECCDQMRGKIISRHVFSSLICYSSERARRQIAAGYGEHGKIIRVRSLAGEPVTTATGSDKQPQTLPQANELVGRVGEIKLLNTNHSGDKLQNKLAHKHLHRGQIMQEYKQLILPAGN